MTYQETLDYLFTKLPMFTRIGATAFKKDLTNTIALCEALGNPHKKFKTIHIAGTNGKGSTSHMLAAVLQSAGYKTGLYTSPHLHDFRERIKVNGQMCEQAFVVDFTKRVTPLIDTIEPSFFEITVAMAFDYFAQQQVDIAVIEVGLGGRLDSTNIVTPVLSVITNIGYDHMNMLGNTLELIASEKAGIIKPNIPVVIGEYLPETKPIFIKKAKQENAPIVFAQEKRYVADFKNEHHQLTIDVAEHGSDMRHSYVLDLPGIYQTKNILTVIQAIHLLRVQGWQLDETIVKKALHQVKKLTGFYGRWQLVHEHPSIVFDVAHNEDGIRQLTEQLELPTYQHLHIVMGMVKDKDIAKVLKLMPKNATYYFSKAPMPRALEEATLHAMAAEFGLTGKHYSTVNNALQAAVNSSDKQDLIVVCGSVFIVAEANIDAIKF
ncbi:MAG: folylpolyglutamate synthase/dihydrofolate synthase family protein [Flavobacterium sp.]|nr:folylpolyglutamate synthase/dihydrofolate synthase family protein [Flavobacterium sp.]